MNSETRAIYARSGWGGRLRWGPRPAIVVVDLINAFTSDNFALGSDLSDVVTDTSSLIRAARTAGTEIPVIFTTIAFEQDLADAGVWPQKCTGLSDLMRGSKAVQVDDRLGKSTGDLVIEKQGASAFFGTNLSSLLVARQVDTVVLCGASTSGCIRASAVDAMQHGFACIVPSSCVGDRSREQHDSNLFDIDSKYADVCDLDSAITYITAGS